MSNSKKIASIAFTGAAATAATMMAAAPALAGSAFTIKAGGVKIVPPTTVKGKIKAGTTATLVDTTKNTTLTCKKMTFSGTLSKASGTTPTRVGTITKTSWSSCTGPFGLTFKAHLNIATGHKVGLFVSKVTTTGASGYIAGASVGNTISGKISGTGLAAACHATISAASTAHIPAVYNNANHSLNINPNGVNNLHIKSAKSCAGAINTSDTAHFKAVTVISVPAGLTIS